MYSGADTLAGGFPHSETSGSQLVCQLPEAFRRLPRLSSPIIAKASTTCSCSLDPITLKPSQAPRSCFQVHLRGLAPRAFSCRNANFFLGSTTGFLPQQCFENHSSLLKQRFFQIHVRFDAIKFLPLMARCILQCFPSAALIRLYEFLRNSREAFSSFSSLANANIKTIIFPCFDIAACVVGGG